MDLRTGVITHASGCRRVESGRAPQALEASSTSPTLVVKPYELRSRTHASMSARFEVRPGRCSPAVHGSVRLSRIEMRPSVRRQNSCRADFRSGRSGTPLRRRRAGTSCGGLDVPSRLERGRAFPAPRSGAPRSLQDTPANGPQAGGTSGSTMRRAHRTNGKQTLLTTSRSTWAEAVARLSPIRIISWAQPRLLRSVLC